MASRSARRAIKREGGRSPPATRATTGRWLFPQRPYLDLRTCGGFGRGQSPSGTLAFIRRIIFPAILWAPGLLRRFTRYLSSVDCSGRGITGLPLGFPSCIAPIRGFTRGGKSRSQPRQAPLHEERILPKNTCIRTFCAYPPPVPFDFFILASWMAVVIFTLTLHQH